MCNTRDFGSRAVLVCLCGQPMTPVRPVGNMVLPSLGTALAPSRTTQEYLPSLFPDFLHLLLRFVVVWPSASPTVLGTMTVSGALMFESLEFLLFLFKNCFLYSGSFDFSLILD